MEQRPLIEMYQVMPGVPPPTPAGRPAVMSLPAKALRLCPPVIGASELGWYVYPPLDMTLCFDGQQVNWKDPEGNWHRVAPGDEAQAEGWREQYTTMFPSDLVEALPNDWPGLYNADPNAPNRIEMYLGLIVRTAPGWSLLVRQPANLPRRLDMILYEGVLETDWWSAWLPTIVELTTPLQEVHLRRSRPLAQVQLVPSDLLYGRAKAVIGTIDEVPADLWEQFRANRMRRTSQDRSGSYHRLSRQVRRQSGGGDGDGDGTEDHDREELTSSTATSATADPATT